MTDHIKIGPDEFRDNLSKMAFPLLVNLLGKPPEEALQLATQYGRDKCRTPMQWSNSPNGGFCPPGVTPWLPVNPNYAAGVNVADQQPDPGSLLNFYRRMLRVRRVTPALISGDFIPLHEQADDYLAFSRQAPGGESACLVVLNYSEKALKVSFDSPGKTARLIFSSLEHRSQADPLSEIKLEPFEIYIVEITKGGIT